MAPRKKKTTEVEVPKETIEAVTKTFDILERKKALVEMYADMELVCRAILAKAKVNPSEIKSSLLKEVIVALKALQGIITFTEALDKELSTMKEVKSSDDGMTASERRSVDAFQQAMVAAGIAKGMDPL